MSDTPKRQRKGGGRKRGFFVRGLVVVLPAVLTVFVFVTVLQFADRHVAGPINRVIYASLDGNTLGWRALGAIGIDPTDASFLLPVGEQPKEIADLYRDPDLLELALDQEVQDITELIAFQTALGEVREGQKGFFRPHQALGIDSAALREEVEKQMGPWAGILIAAGLVLTVGYLASGFLGRSAVAAMDRLVSRVPLVRAVYPHAKQLVDFFLAENELKFDTVVAAPYPSQGLWSIGFVTSKGLKTLHEARSGQYVAVYIPSSPLPLTGYTIFVEAARLVPLDVSVEQAFRTVVSVGVLIPESEKVEGLADTMARLGVPGPQESGPQETGEGAPA